MKRSSLLLASVMIFVLASSIRGADPFVFDAPKEWRPERIPFPLGFAPELKYRGFEELRFGPGMFRPGTETYWTYVFFWWIEGNQKFTKEGLEKDLRAYYRGLSNAVGKPRGFKIIPDKITASLQPNTEGKVEGPKSLPKFTGILRTYDAFKTGRLLKLNIEISQHHFKDINRTWVFFSVSPHSRDSMAWLPMRKIRESFKLK